MSSREAKGIDDALTHRLTQSVAAHALNNHFEQAEVRVAVREASTGFEEQGMTDTELDRALEADWHPVRIQVANEAWIVLEVEETAPHSKQMLDCHSVG
jgi:hypothetical protein